MDVHVIWQCGMGPVRMSADGAQTWQAVSDYGNCRLMSFWDANMGWIATAHQLGATTDGGITWDEVALPEGVQEIAAISLRTPTDGYLLDITGVLHITQDGGQSWTSHTLGQSSEISSLPSASAVVHFFDADRGLVVMHLAGGLSSKIVMLRTTDGGQTWQQEDVIPASPLIALYLSRDGSTLTITDKIESLVTVLRYVE